METKNFTISWTETDKALKEETLSGYKVACLESRKVFVNTLKQNNIPVENLEKTLKYYGWKFSQLKELESAVTVCDQIINDIEYNLSTFQAEDTVAAFKAAVLDLTDNLKKITWQRALMMTINQEKNNSQVRNIFLWFILLLFSIKGLTTTTWGAKIVDFSNYIFNLFIYLLVIAIIISIFALIFFLFLDKKKETKIKKVIEN